MARGTRHADLLVQPSAPTSDKRRSRVLSVPDRIQGVPVRQARRLVENGGPLGRCGRYSTLHEQRQPINSGAHNFRLWHKTDAWLLDHDVSFWPTFDVSKMILAMAVCPTDG